MKRYELTKEQWIKLRDYLPPEHKKQGGRPGKDNRLMLNAMLYRLSTGIAWRDLPKRYGPWQSVYSRYRTWLKLGIWEKLAEDLYSADNSPQEKCETRFPQPDCESDGKKRLYF